MKKTQLPVDAVVGINNICNSRCIMCNIWKIKSFPEIDPKQYYKLPPTLKDINISGGETFLRKEIVDIVRVMTEACPKARIIISTNGFLTDLIEKQMKKILKINPKIGVAISIDGIEDMHYKVRRIPNAYGKAMDTLERLKSLGMTNLRMAFTILPQNVEHFGKVYDESRKRGVQFTHTFAQDSENYFGGIEVDNAVDLRELKEQYGYIIKSELRTWNAKRWARAFFSLSMYRFITQKHQPLDMSPGIKSFFLSSDGTVFPSVVHDFPMGNIKEDKAWNELWQGDKANKARRDVQEKGRYVWLICTARTAMKSHPFKVGWWIFKNKFFGVKL